MRSAADEFIGSKPVVYSGFDGNLYIARFQNGERNGLGVPSLTITRGGDVVKDIIVCEATARTFFWNLDPEGE